MNMNAGSVVMKTIKKLLVANRGEVAARIMRTCHRMGIATVAIYSDADVHAPFVRYADEAVRLGPADSRESYLNVERLLDAARQTGADAVHPGFGFLAENAEFAEECIKAGLTFVGPNPHAIRAMGSKKAAKELVAHADVPIVPGYHGNDQGLEELVRQAIKLGFPLLIKASAGGGGKGMRIVRSEQGLLQTLESAKREALNAFADDTLLLERYVEKPRHVEIQILGDKHGNLVHLFERECSIQRRHQKIIEEAPSPVLSPELRERMGQAALRVGKTVNYDNAGTVEFILGADQQFYFLEVNTRLQVEHPVTECITGIDIVREQILIAQGEKLTLNQKSLSFQGAAIECRLYAEDPAQGFLPTTGMIHDWHLPEEEGLRVESGVETGFEVGIHYDPMLAKIITYAPTRREAIRKMIRSLNSLSVFGVTTNRSFLTRVLDHPAFVAGDTTTHFIETYMGDSLAETTNPQLEKLALWVATLAQTERNYTHQAPLPSIRIGFRNSLYSMQKVSYSIGEQQHDVLYRSLGHGKYIVQVAEQTTNVLIELGSGLDVTMTVEGGTRCTYRVLNKLDKHFVHSKQGNVVLREHPRFPEKIQEVQPGSCIAPMPGKVVKLCVELGQSVHAGQVLLILEAMKMEHSVSASQDGTVEQLLVEQGQQVEADTVLAVVAEASA
jgi:3-methylcrotonyl-CoA carboxylase alpha subunit